MITAPGTANLGIGKSGAISGVTLSEAGATATETFTVKLGDTNGLLSATGTGITGSGSKALTISGSLAAVNADLATLKDLDAVAGSDTISLGVTDSLGNNGASSISVTTAGLPVLTAPPSETLGLGQTLSISGTSLAETGAAASEIFTITLTDTNGLLSATGSGVSGSGSKALTIAGTLAQVNADLATLKDADGVAGADKISLAVTDGYGNTGSSSISVTAVTLASPPVLTAPASLVIGAGETASVSGITLAQTGAIAGETFTVTLSDGIGLLSATGAGITGSGSKALTISGTLAQVNADLATLKDADTTPGSDTINLGVSDSLGSHTSGSIAVTVNGLPDVTAPAAETISLGRPASISGIDLAETGNTTGEIFTVTLNDSHGLLTALGQNVTGSGTDALTLSGTLAQINADLATLRDKDSTSGSDSITIAASDNLGDHGTSKAVLVIATSISGVPVITAPGKKGVDPGDPTTISGITVAETPIAAGESFTVTLADTTGLLSATGTGITGEGSKLLTITGSLAVVNADLATVTDTETAPGADIITISATDSLGGVANPASIDLQSSQTISSGTSFSVPSGVTISNVILNAGGTVLLSSGATADTTTVRAGGLLGVLQGATANATSDFGTMGVAGITHDTEIHSGGAEYVTLGTSFDPIIDRGGIEVVLSGGTAADPTIEAGGTLAVFAGGTVTGTIAFDGNNANLILAGTSLTTAAIGGFDQNGARGDAITLANFTYVAGHDSATLGSDHVVTLNLDGTIEHLNLDPAESVAGHTFSVHTNTLGQVVILDPVSATVSQMGFLAPAQFANALKEQMQNAALFHDIRDNNAMAASFLPVTTHLHKSTTAAGLIGGNFDSFSLQSGVMSIAAKLSEAHNG